MIITIIIMIAIVMVFSAVIVVLMSYATNLSDVKNEVRMPFEDFIVLYKQEPNSFDLSDGFPTFYGKMRHYNITFNFSGYLKYMSWLKETRSKQTEDDFIKELSEFKGEKK